MATADTNIIAPKEIILPVRETGSPQKAGAIFLSGAKLYFYTGSAFELVTSA